MQQAVRHHSAHLFARDHAPTTLVYGYQDPAKVKGGSPRVAPRVWESATMREGTASMSHPAQLPYMDCWSVREA